MKVRKVTELFLQILLSISDSTFCNIQIVDYFCGGILNFRGVAQLASALAWGARGRLFESDHPDNSK